VLGRHLLSLNLVELMPRCVMIWLHTSSSDQSRKL
jgi:hypothetical protein